ncbi:PARP-type zinc finger-containing protein [Neolecta irregularis DAH-3]|uniref:PARP-type zinc finger-containing protein n=1 Tax=Neolecta irregularis (strain DAH-3) TaxID=1198029 RepID=A0A1U7LGF7_NEOID|nr:PARP-type zinc finger-containing protein [Neolecta irregularis DAH-3]|eukprot:OLL21729.1 PARP-type zinc finger-containing protein [Neolecta irregularis DAH-3]
MPAYRIEYAASARSKCKANTCGQAKIEKGALRFGTWVDSGRFQSYAWRHWGCVTPKVLENVGNAFDDIEKEMDGYDEIEDRDKLKIKAAVESGQLAEEDKTVPVDGHKESGDEEENPKKKSGRSKEKVVSADEEPEEPSGEKTPKKRGRTKKSDAKLLDEAKIDTEENTFSRSKRAKRGEPKNYNENDDGFDDEDSIPKKKSSKSKKVTKDADPVDDKLKKARGLPKKSDGIPAEVPKKRGRPTKKAIAAEGLGIATAEEALTEIAAE